MPRVQSPLIIWEMCRSDFGANNLIYSVSLLRTGLVRIPSRDGMSSLLTTFKCPVGIYDFTVTETQR